MSEVLVVYFTSTGNTEMLAESVAEGIEAGGATAILKNVSDATIEEISNYEKIALGCSASGEEELDENEFEPYFEEALPELKGKKIMLFGCYGWGGGEFMRTWEDRVREGEAELFEEGFINLETPDDEALENVKALAQRFASA